LVDEVFLKPNQVVQMGYPPLRIDLSTGIAGIEFGECWGARVTAESEGTPIYFMDIEDLRRNKRASGRPQDIADEYHLE
jgi:hypothetical protein